MPLAELLEKRYGNKYTYLHIGRTSNLTFLKPNRFHIQGRLPTFWVFVTTVEFVCEWAIFIGELGPAYLYGIREQDLPPNYALEEGINGWDRGDIRIVTEHLIPVTYLREV
ncbi:MAG: hypothetical protein Greene071421_138 [Parcubacteria group bacterium Greene0714_21]|nr:MAG: hypothetical protein Greene041639_214 [Parcubacteria group bacterium Greene0416_39]TSC98541.1 MAG: hypothetical protein Greene101447_43 [Parcubacteria group bacterium Greene1014_47]TSD04302.1 MAG: hypothetical protein Greene071421_138 [Parcubacteria group bacterium Greene0714_21]